MQPKYNIYPTLLDAFQYYLKSEDDNSFQSFIDKLNRVSFYSEAAAKGTAFNNLIDKLIAESKNGLVSEFYLEFDSLPDDAKISFEGFEFKKSVVVDFYQRLKYTLTQVFTKAYIETKYGVVKLYGYIDNLDFGSPIDVKTTSRYDFPKYLHNWQHIVYPYCLIHGDGVQPDAASNFQYRITDFNNIFEEAYTYKEERDLPKLTLFIERFIEFIEQHREIITDKKLFAEDERSIEEEVQAQ